jgi:hypothetical protein
MDHSVSACGVDKAGDSGAPKKCMAISLHVAHMIFQKATHMSFPATW